MSEGEEEGTSPSSRRSSEASEHAPPYMTRMQRFLAATRARFAIFTEPHAPQPAFPGQGRARGSWGSPGSPTAEMVLEDCDACDEDCPICLGTLESGVVQTPCKHKFHRECIERYFLGAREPGAKARCPICRGAVHAPLPIEASSRSGLPIEVVGLPAVGSAVHFDRRYQFTDMGGFGEIGGMLYVMTSNDDRHTSYRQVMWTLESEHTLDIHLNYRSENHLAAGNAEAWLRAGGWERNQTIRSAVTSGIPNGPYSGPVFSKRCPPGRTHLQGSQYWEGTYLVFVRMVVSPSPGAASPAPVE